jgi:Predicted endonuclease distantly related to archaeal Holliday junction resolvase
MTEDLSITSQHKRPAIRSSTLVGEKGERLAAEFLENAGYRTVLANFKVPVGRNSNGAQVTGEIDIIALDGETLCFVEVKTRVANDFAEPSAAVTLRKQRQITRTAKVYRRIFDLTEMPYRYDVVSIVLGHSGDPTIELLREFWNDKRFVKRTWNHEIW